MITLAYYDTFLKTSRSPKKMWKDGLQALVDYSFENTSTIQFDVEEEIDFGTLEFAPITVRVNSLVDAKTGQRINDDYKKLIFKDLDYKPKIGTRYRFDNNIWIVFSTDNVKTDTSSVYVRRCNNTMNIQDKYGNIHREPVYIDYKVTENQIFRNYSIDVPSGRIYFQCQLNDYTKNIDVNDRYIFGGDVYKIREKSAFDRRYTFEEESCRIMSFYADYDNIGENDNKELGVANYVEYNYSIDCQSHLIGNIGEEGTIGASVILNGEEVEESLIWYSTDENIAYINSENGQYQLINIGQCEFIIKMKNNQSVECRIQVNVSKELEDKYEYKIFPDVDIIRLNKTESFNVFEYFNDEKTDTIFNFEVSGVPNKYYIFNSDNKNSFSVTNLKQYNDGFLNIVCVPLNSSNPDVIPELIISVRLGGII